MSAITDTDTVDTAYQGLYIIGGVAALIAGVIGDWNENAKRRSGLTWMRRSTKCSTAWYG